jgi:acyl-CoA synthetase (AMP-forming)/AMP-acid ligase II
LRSMTGETQPRSSTAAGSERWRLRKSSVSLSWLTPAAVIGVPSEQRGEAVHAVIVPKDGAAVTPEELTTHCRQHIGGYKLARSYEFRSEPLPVTSVGKVRKNVLRDPWWAGRERKI